MNLRIGKIEGYNNNILIAPANVNVGVQADVNNKPIVKHAAAAPPRHTIKTPIHTTPPKYTTPLKPTTPSRHTTPPKHATPPRHTIKIPIHTTQDIPPIPPEHATPHIHTTFPEQPLEGEEHEDTKTALITAGVGLIIGYIWLK
ncbi:uncharacterized protein LOC130625180 [Hydractinia symbiolongicarpus]|uniref:uncharacterized protein LOC130625180 n=1 Tax=Hydractinia symbiolongicarpus TaxID=13093 RepID=UPI00254E32A7|nr:uncharacterized protein LOC130625180 [Hydractinia symbiolongicarpus]